MKVYEDLWYVTVAVLANVMDRSCDRGCYSTVPGPGPSFRPGLGVGEIGQP